MAKFNIDMAITTAKDYSPRELSEMLKRSIESNSNDKVNYINVKKKIKM